MRPYLLLRLEAPLMAFGDVIVDTHGRISDIPAPSAVTGLLANALGWRRHEHARLARLQGRLRYAVRRDRDGERVMDFQTAQLGKDDEAWTTFGEPLGRTGSPNTYDSPLIRRRWYDADACLTIALRLDPHDEEPDLSTLATALNRPARPLFLGRKPCIPSSPIVFGVVEAETACGALLSCSLGECHDEAPRVFWMPGEGPASRSARKIFGMRDWANGVHVGQQLFHEGRSRNGVVA